MLKNNSQTVTYHISTVKKVFTLYNYEFLFKIADIF